MDPENPEPLTPDPSFITGEEKARGNSNNSAAGGSVHVSLGNLLVAHGQLAGAEASYRRAIAANPHDWIASLKLAHVLKLSGQTDAALQQLESLAAQQPGNPLVHKEFGRVYFARQQYDEAVASFHAVLERNPRDADAHHWLASINHLRGSDRTAQQHFERTVSLNPLVRVPAIRSPASFAVLFLFAPRAGNTPPTALVKMAEYDSYFLLLVAGADYDVASLGSRAQLVVNLVSDVDLSRDVLPLAASLADQLGLPVVNHPSKIIPTDRESISRLLAGIAGCRVPRVRYVAAQSSARSGSRETSEEQQPIPEFSRIPLWEGFEFPLLIRVAGTHGGKDFDKVDSPADLARFIAGHPAADFYLAEYVDYRSLDGFFRKYRFIFVGDEILPYHLAIGEHWKVHHGTTDMARCPWMQHEEEAFLDRPASIFTAGHFATLGAIRQAVGLDYFGIDCSIDREGNVVVFEVNASMLVHDENAAFAYKAPHVERIKGAFDAMLENLAAGPSTFSRRPAA